MTGDLFQQSLTEAIENSTSGQLKFYPAWLNQATADRYFLALKREIDWQEESIKMYGRSVTVPRLVAWYGDPDAAYTYSGVLHQPKPWIKPLEALRNKIKDELNIVTNSVLANLYRDGLDSMGWHSDNEAELGDEPTIVSVSLGQPRYFDFRAIENHRNKHRLELTHGSLLIMSGAFQHQWQHQIPKQRRISESRINLTFRYVHLAE